MKKYNGLSAAFIVVLGFLLVDNVSSAQEYEPWTGAVTGANIHLGGTQELTRIRRLINEGKTADAVRLARRYIESHSSIGRGGSTSRFVYDGYNALCISLTSNKQFAEAMSACDTAIEHSPNRWQAINSRGSLNYISGKFDDALRDYQKAYEMSPNVDRIKKIIQHNIEISQARVAGN